MSSQNREMREKIVTLLAASEEKALKLQQLAAKMRVDYQVLQGVIDQMERDKLIRILDRDDALREVIILRQQALAARSSASTD